LHGGFPKSEPGALYFSGRRRFQGVQAQTKVCGTQEGVFGALPAAAGAARESISWKLTRTGSRQLEAVGTRQEVFGPKGNGPTTHAVRRLLHPNRDPSFLLAEIA
jgi:hypothetical protein